MRILFILIEGSPEEWPDGARALNHSIWKTEGHYHRNICLTLEAYNTWRKGFCMFCILLKAIIPSVMRLWNVASRTDINRMPPSIVTPSGILGGSKAPYLMY